MLKTETVVNAAHNTQSQAAASSEGVEKIELNQVFSAELGKQIDKRDPTVKTAEQHEVSTDPVQNIKSASTQKAEKRVDEHGKPLPTESEIVDTFVEQLINDADITPAVKQELKQAIEQFVDTFLNGEDAEQPLEKSLTELITQLVKATSGQGLSGENQKNITEKGAAEFPIKAATQETIKNILQGIGVTGAGVSNATEKPIQSIANSESYTKVISSFIPVSEELKEKTTGKKGGLSEQLSAAIAGLTDKAGQKPGQTEQIERVQTVLQQIKEVILKEVTTGSPQKTDRAGRIAELVKKVIPEKAPTLTKVTTALKEQITSSS